MSIIRDRLLILKEVLESGRERALGAFTDPSHLTFDQRGALAHDILRRTVNRALNEVTGALRALDAPGSVSPTSEPPLEDVLDEIVAKGHRYELYGPHYPSPDSGALIITRHAHTPGWAGGSIEDHQRWREKVEQGEAEDSTPLAAARTRLDQIRELHALQEDELNRAASAEEER